jgi:HSP20 family protein
MTREYVVGRVTPANVFRDVEQIMGTVFRDVANTVSRTPLANVAQKASYPKVDIRDTPDVTYVDATVPGLKREDVTIDYEDGCVKISADGQEAADGEFLHREIHRSSFCRWFPVDESIYDIDNIEAVLADGILTLTVPRRDEAKAPVPRKITVK